MLALNLLKQRLLRVRPAASLTIQTPVVLRLHFPVLLMLWSALATNLHLVNVALVFLVSSFPAQDCSSGVPWFLWNWWNVDRALIARAPSVMFQFENRPTAPPVSTSPANGRKKMWNWKLLWKLFNGWEGSDGRRSSDACGLRSLCAAAERRSSSLCSQMQCGWLLLMDDCRTNAYRLSSASSTVSMTVLVVFSILSLP